jgi:hypothetical protein
VPETRGRAGPVPPADSGPDRDQRTAARLALAGWGLAAASLVAFGLLLAFAKARPAALPVLREGRFARLSAAPVVARAAGDSAGPRERWFVAINPWCPHCRASLPAAIARAAISGNARVAVLLVDTRARWPADSLAAMSATDVWWDSAGIGRREWRRSDYGEILIFDQAGRLQRTIAPGGPAPAGDRP